MRNRNTNRSTWIELSLLLGLLAAALPALAQSEEEMDGVTMQMVTEEDELSGEMMREIELQAPKEMESGEGSGESGSVDELEAGIIDEAEGLQDDFAEDVITGSDDDLTDDIGDVEEQLIDEDGDISVPIDDVIDDGEDLLGDTTDELEDGVDETTDELEGTTEETTDEVEGTLDP